MNDTPSPGAAPPGGDALAPDAGAHATDSTREESGSDRSDGASISVPLSFELATMSLPLSRLQAIQQGAVLDVAASDGSLPVRILASGRLLAKGTLVSIGDGYGVLVGEPAGED